MASMLTSTLNTRPVLPDDMRFLRSDAPTELSCDDADRLAELGVGLFIDLRSEEEAARRPIPADDRFRVLHMPVTGGQRLPEDPDRVWAGYLNMVDGQMVRILHTILTAGTGVLFFCTAGKDRTGMVSALLQRHFGMDREAIIADYLLSGENLRARLAQHLSRHPGVDPRIITPRRETMEAVLDALPPDSVFFPGAN